MQTCMSKNAVNCNSVTVELPSFLLTSKGDFGVKAPP